jgi:hypothetical protein
VRRPRCGGAGPPPGAASTMSLLALIRHMADVERNWFRRAMAQADGPPLYRSDPARPGSTANELYPRLKALETRGKNPPNQTGVCRRA